MSEQVNTEAEQPAVQTPTSHNDLIKQAMDAVINTPEEGASVPAGEEKQPVTPTATEEVTKEIPAANIAGDAPEAKEEPEVTEPVISAREKFARAAEEEKAQRGENVKLKQWEAKLKEREAEIEKAARYNQELEKDPLSFFEKRMPKDTFEKLVAAYSEGKLASPEDNELSAVKQKIAQLEEQLSKTGERTQEEIGQQRLRNYMQEVDREYVGEDYGVIREYITEWEAFNGERVNLHDAVSEIFVEMLNKYEKSITPAQALEILKEESIERLDRMRRYRKTETEKTQAKEEAPAKDPGNVRQITNSLETQSATGGEDDIPEGMTASEYAKYVVKKFASNT